MRNAVTIDTKETAFCKEILRMNHGMTLRHGFKLLSTIHDRRLTERKYQKCHEYRHKETELC